MMLIICCRIRFKHILDAQEGVISPCVDNYTIEGFYAIPAHIYKEIEKGTYDWYIPFNVIF